jgi:hypothetical protein
MAVDGEERILRFAARFSGSDECRWRDVSSGVQAYGDGTLKQKTACCKNVMLLT